MAGYKAYYGKPWKKSSTEITEIGYDNTWYKLKSPISLTFKPWEYGVYAVNKEFGIHETGRSTPFREDDAKDEAVINAKRALAHKYEMNFNISDDNFTEFGLKLKYKLIDLVIDKPSQNAPGLQDGIKINTLLTAQRGAQ